MCIRKIKLNKNSLRLKDKTSLSPETQSMFLFKCRLPEKLTVRSKRKSGIDALTMHCCHHQMMSASVSPKTIVYFFL